MYVCVERGGRKCICIKSKEKYTRVRAPQYGGDLYAKKKKNYCICISRSAGALRIRLVYLYTLRNL